MSVVEAVIREIREIGFEAEEVTLPNYGRAVALDYAVPTGRLRGRTFRVAIGLQDIAYPEYPPHFLHVRSLPDPALTSHTTYEWDGGDWTAFSVPPSDFWDRLPPGQKTMKTYFRRHLQRVWGEL